MPVGFHPLSPLLHPTTLNGVSCPPASYVDCKDSVVVAKYPYMDVPRLNVNRKGIMILS